MYTLFGPSLPSSCAYSHPLHSPLLLSRIISTLFLQLTWRENIVDNKKDKVFLLLWGKDSYTERFLVLLPCTCVLQHTLAHLYQTSLQLPGPLPIVASASWTLLYLLLYSKHNNNIQVLGFLPFPYTSSASSSLRVWPLSKNITAFVLGL
jgi:hypothetical protein